MSFLNFLGRVAWKRKGVVLDSVTLVCGSDSCVGGPIIQSIISVLILINRGEIRRGRMGRLAGVLMFKKVRQGECKTRCMCHVEVHQYPFNYHRDLDERD